MHIQMRTKGQITIPISIRHELGIRKGTYIHFVIDKSSRRIILTPITREYVHSVRGMFKGSGAMQVLMEEKKREASY